ncbi:ABC transporter permease [Paracoccus fontiphilus]|uniref:Transport permease protein n=1 Tax=Paracoccus fontiphilus TaxID=1815556 RepID=A0ABV7IKF3_9RHOB|nr:ABC transporter permease [Paracoccus fontiphilus]
MDLKRLEEQPSRLRPTGRFHALPALRSILALILREMATSYGRSPGGFLWVLAEPILGIAFLVTIFSLGFRSPPLGDSFALFYATGFLPFIAFNVLNKRVGGAISYSRNLLAYPRVSYMDTLIARTILTAMIQLVVFSVLLTGILVFQDTRTVLLIDRVILAYCMVIAFGFGIGVLNSFLMTMFPIWSNIWSIATAPLMILSGVILLYENLPKSAQAILWFNPLVHISGEMRSAFYLGYEANYVNPAYVFGISLGLILIGLIFLGRYHRDMLER